MGPGLLEKNFLKVFLRLRQHNYAIFVDIEDVPSGRSPRLRSNFAPFFLWRGDTTSDVVINQYTRHTFGTSQKTPKDSIYIYTESAGNEKFYLEVYLDSFADFSNAIKIRRDLVL